MVAGDPALGRHRSDAETGRRRFAVFGAVFGAALLAYTAAYALRLPVSALSLAFALPLFFVAPVGWLAFRRAPAGQRVLWAVLSSAGTIALAGAFVWGYSFVSSGVPLVEPGPWDAFFFAAYALALVGVVVAVHGLISLTHAVLDALVLLAAGLAVGAALLGRALERGLSGESVASLTRPVLGVVILTLIVTAALEARDGVPLSIALVGIGQGLFTVGSLIYSFGALRGDYADAAWAYIAWFPGLAVSVLGALVVILRIDRPLQLAGPARIPQHPAGARTVLYGSLGALATSVAVTLYGHATYQDVVLFAGLGASVAIGAAMTLRAATAIGEVEIAYERLDRGRFAEEQARDELLRANDELARTNVELRLVQESLRDLLALADERTGGRLRALIESSGDDVARLLRDYLR